MHTYTPANSIFDGPITNLLSVLSILIDVLSRAHAKGEKALMISNLALLLVIFRVAGEASMAVNGLIQDQLPSLYVYTSQWEDDSAVFALTTLPFTSVARR